MNYISRKYYLNKFIPYIGKNLIKVVTGQRRVGKSFILYELMDYVRLNNPDSDIIYINMELDDFSGINNHKDLISHVKKHRINKNKLCFLFVDEIQNIIDFEKAVISLMAENNFDIYITGSNADLLSGELATRLGGRYIEIKVFSLTYPEFLFFRKLDDSEDAFLQYLRFGGMPYLIHLPPEEYLVYDYLKNVFNTIVLKDVVSRFNIRNVNFLERLVRFICDNTGHIVSAKKISDYLKSQRTNISAQVVLNYLNYLAASFLILKVSRYDLQGKKIFEIGEKYYFEDIGIRNSVVGFKITDIDSILENVVFLHLAAAGYRVFVGTKNEKEIDFVAEKSGEKIYVQVCYLLAGKKVIDREFGNLLAVNDNFPKYVVSMDVPGQTATYEGIKHLNIREFCRSVLKK